MPLVWAGLRTAEPGRRLKINSTFDGGVDAWAITPKRPDPSSPDGKTGSVLLDHDSLGLPDSDTKWNYRPVSPWLRFTSSIELGPNLEANLKLRADQLMGAHVDVANLDWAFSPYGGVRAGVLNFNTNWCRTCDVDTPWIVDPDIFCRGNAYININNAAPGLQAYTNTALGEYQLQTLVGFIGLNCFLMRPKNLVSTPLRWAKVSRFTSIEK